MKTDVVRLRITPEQKAKIKERAEAENRSLSNWLENLIRRELAKQAEQKEA